ncbi:hypothetical protein QBA57_18445 [Streptomyces scabiei]|uniref:hypothetical protein n=1 Tax=Streptomyces scabiei TaxID=1930 RepID=UPI001B309203|nr:MULTISPECIES: hypothetical protein [Streptomyces]MBP5862313.1 hypothetical protein [Streptomyces sp. LBUM 1484]MBP5885061.1 hypothetical protein [Streptomyces sp. LBUM 1487]MBP5901029.1 hypothetical protein [Streptomyces sp. LBUM 1488]MDW8474551.1 hypothetical protein [Streptomyces scabiei]MDX2567304.1 hypothetical protein [Streptomyces scabiei]
MRPDHPMLLHRSPAPARATCAPEPGFWCEWRYADGRRISSAAQQTPASAVRWARIQIRIIASAVEAAFIDPLVDRRDQGWRDAASALKQGTDFTLPLTAEPHSFVWHARPVTFLPLVGGHPRPHLPDGGPPWV